MPAIHKNASSSLTTQRYMQVIPVQLVGPHKTNANEEALNSTREKEGERERERKENWSMFIVISILA